MSELIEIITADGVAHDLDTCVTRGVDDLSGMLATPERRGKNLVVPGAHGELHIVGKRHEAQTLVLSLWVRGVQADGTPPPDSVGQQVFLANLRELLGWFVVDELVTLRHTLADGTSRQIVGEVLDAIEPELEGSGRYRSGLVKIALSCPSPFWSDTLDVSQTVTSLSGAPTTLSVFAGATAPMEDLLIVFGPQNNPRLTQESTGVFVAVGRVIASGQTITVDTSTWQVYGSSGVAGGLYEDLVYGGRGTSRWFALSPEPGGGTPIVKLSHTSTGARSVTVTGRRKYKV